MGSDATLEFVSRLGKLLQEGKNQLVVDAATLMQAGKLSDAIDLLNKNKPATGQIQETKEGLKLLAFNWDGTPIEHMFSWVKGFKNIGVVDSGASPEAVKKIFTDSFDYVPKSSVGAVGWTAIKPENIKGGTSLTKAELAEAYESRTKEFFEPVFNYLDKIGIKPKDRALVSSVSYSGIDKAIMDMGQSNNIPTVTVTPYVYGIYGRNAHPFPTVFTPDIPSYVDVTGKLANTIVLTGGRDHAYKFDAGGKWLLNNGGMVVPVDVLKDFGKKGIEVPAMLNGKIENAAAVAIEKFEDAFPKGMLKLFEDMPFDLSKQDLQHRAQKALAASIWKQYSGE